MILQRYLLLSIGVLAILGVSGCGGSGGPGGGGSTTALIKGFNASPNSTALDFLVNQTGVGTKLAYLSSNPTYIQVPSGDVDLAVQEDADPTTQAIVAQQVSNNTRALLVAVGLVTPPNTEFGKQMQPIFVPFDNGGLNGNKAKLVIIHGFNRAPGMQTPDIDFQNPGQNPQFSSKNIAFGGSSTLVVDSGTQTFVATFPGTTDTLTPPVTFNFQAGQAYGAIVTGVEGSATTPPIIQIVPL